MLPNLRRMQVKVGIHESEVSRISLDQKATLRIEAFPSQPLRGTVKKIGNVAETTWMGSSNEYSVVIHIDELPNDMQLKPGMNAQVEISAGTYPSVLGVPIQGVASFGGKRYVYVEKDRDEFDRLEVEVGKSNVSFVEILSGLKGGEKIALDAYQRSVEDFGNVEPEEVLAVDETETKPEQVAEVEDDETEGVGKTSEEGGGVQEPDAIIAVQVAPSEEDTKAKDESKSDAETKEAKPEAKSIPFIRE